MSTMDNGAFACRDTFLLARAKTLPAAFVAICDDGRSIVSSREAPVVTAEDAAAFIAKSFAPPSSVVTGSSPAADAAAACSTSTTGEDPCRDYGAACRRAAEMLREAEMGHLQ